MTTLVMVPFISIILLMTTSQRVYCIAHVDMQQQFLSSVLQMYANDFTVMLDLICMFKFGKKEICRLCKCLL